MSKLSQADIHSRLAELPHWAQRGEAITRTMKFPSFPDAIAFLTRLAFAAEGSDHHPDLHISFRTVTISWSTHSEGGVTEKDFAGAKVSDTIAKAFGV
jgi:4a-hydroxytetrahydrobiopterin dehydratase